MTDLMQHQNVSLRDIEDAASRLEGIARRTPLIEDDVLNARCNARILIKPECLQYTGSFKIRGAYNRLSRMSAEEKRAGVVAFSSGNHAQGVAAAAKALGIKAKIVMPADAPRMKLENTKRLGADVVLYDRKTEDREAIAKTLAKECGAVLVPSYDDPHIIAGQGTVGLEIALQAQDQGVTIDTALCPVGGGGLIAGTATALKHHFPSISLFGVEPEGFDDTARSLRLGEHVANKPDASSICDALLAPTPGKLTFFHNQRLLDGAYVVTDKQVIAAMRFAFERLKLVVEPGGAVALAALLAGCVDVSGQAVALVISGGNVDRQSFCDF